MRTQATDITSAAGRAASAGRASGGFTLMELLVAVGALAFVAVGIAAIFEATGKTVRAGRRLSDFTATANLIEQQMRADFAAMTREGFLVIRNQYADADGNGTISLPATPGRPRSGDDVVPLYSDDLRPRPRRIDEIMFFAKGQYQSLRDPLDPKLVASSDAAAIYYGHGERARRVNDAQGVPTNTAYMMPELDDFVSTSSGPPGVDSNARLGYQQGTDNPNRYASDWILLRRVTLLCPPQNQPHYRLPTEMPQILSGLPLQNTADNNIQIALQPAESSIFRGLSSKFPLTDPGKVRQGSAQNPRTDSGIIDIATTDLSAIRTIVTTARFPFVGGVSASFFDPSSNQDRVGTGDQQHPGPDGEWVIPPLNTLNGPIASQHAWMDDSLPAYSFGSAAPASFTRVHCEPAPTNLIGVASSGLTDLQRAYRTTDQMMLSASNFLPHCTEFIVEWSFGDNDPGTGQPRWHGLKRYANTQTNRSSAPPLASPYDDSQSAQLLRIQVPLVNPTLTPQVYKAPTLLIHGDITGLQPGDPLSSYFGYIDPTFNPDYTGNSQLGDDSDALNPTMPWPWPKLIRITMSLADPNDPSVEQSFQFVFDVPQNTP